jgi:AmmeMemoRadiSam system protein B
LWHGRGLITPHIDFPRGGHVYAQVWQRARPAILDADLVIIFGTDHNGGPGTFTLTRQDYATPYGVVPTDTALVDELAAALGPDAVFAEELHHQQEHSLEFAVVWLHHIYQQAGIPPRPVVPILLGSFHHFLHNGGHPATDPLLRQAIAQLQAATAERKVLAVASVDFAHVGPAFSDPFVMDERRRNALRQEDEQLMHAITQGDAARFYDRIAAVQDQNRICGFSPIYLMLQYLGATEGVSIAYDQCSADEEAHSLVSIAGIFLE